MMEGKCLVDECNNIGCTWYNEGFCFAVSIRDQRPVDCQFIKERVVGKAKRGGVVHRDCYD